MFDFLLLLCLGILYVLGMGPSTAHLQDWTGDKDRNDEEY